MIIKHNQIYPIVMIPQNNQIATKIYKDFSNIKGQMS